jgi:hypothetical protein
MRKKNRDATRELLVGVCRRLPAGQRLVQEAFTTDHRHAVWVRLTDLRPDTFYALGENTSQAFSDAVVDLVQKRPGGELTLSFPFGGEFRGLQHKLMRLAPRLDRINIFAPGKPPSANTMGSRMEYTDSTGTPLAGYRVALYESAQPILYICREGSGKRIPRLGFFSHEPDIIEGIAEDIEAAGRNLTKNLTGFEKLLALHRTTQQINRELQTYSRKIEALAKMAHRHPELLTPARYEKIVSQAVAKLEQLKKLPLRALCHLDNLND